MINLWLFRQDMDLGYKLVLAVHDAILLEVPVEEVLYVMNDVLPVCMCHGAVVPKIGLMLDVDSEICLRWGEKITESELSECGVEVDKIKDQKSFKH